MPHPPQMQPAIHRKTPLHRLIPILLVLLSLACSLPLAKTPTPTSTQALPTAAPTEIPKPTATPQPLPPGLAEVDPATGGELPLEGPITLYFNQPMDRASVEKNLSSRPGVLTRLVWMDDATLQIQPEAPLQPESQVSLSLGAEARSAQGLQMAQPVSLTYQTAGYLQASQLLPVDGAQEVDPTSAVVAAFNRPVVPLGRDPSAQPPGFSLSSPNDPNPQGRGEWLNTSTYIFYPDPGLVGGETYTARLSLSLTAADGSPLQEEGLNPMEWSFTTSLPRISAFEPAAGGTFIPLDTPISITFNQPMDRLSVESSFQLLSPAGGTIEGQFAWDEAGTSLTFTPAVRLERNAGYTIVLGEGAQGVGGASLQEGLRASFRTNPALRVVATDLVDGTPFSPTSSLTVYLSAPLDENSIEPSVVISPTVSDLRTWFSLDERALRVYGSFAPNTPYILRLLPSLSDIWGGTLDDEAAIPFTTGPLSPSLLVASGQMVIYLTPQDATLSAQVANLPRLPLSLGSLSLDDFLLLSGPDGYENRDRLIPEDERSWEQTINADPNQSQRVEIQVSPDGQPLASGLYLLRPKIALEGWYSGPFVLVVSSTQMTLKLSATEALVWAMDLESGTPTAGMPIQLLDEEGAPLASGQTGPDGVARLSFAPRDDPYRTVYAVSGRPGDPDFSLAASNWNLGLEPYEFGIYSSFSPPRLKLYFYTDRPIYRPGQTVHFRGVARQAYNGRYDLPEASSLPVSLYAESGEELSRLDLAVSEFGTIHGEFPLPDSLQPGYYRIESAEAQSDALFFQVAEYRKPEINLQVSFPVSEALAGEGVSATINARYFFDAPAGNISVSWTLYAVPAYFDLPGYQVGIESTRWLEAFYTPEMVSGLGAVIDSGEGRTAQDGTLTLSLPSQIEAGRQRYTLEATVQDESGLLVSARAWLNVNPARFYIGINPDRWLGRSGEEASFDVQVVDWAARPAGGQALRAEFSKVSWGRKTQLGSDPFTASALEAQYAPVASTDFSANRDGQARVAFTPPEPGTYRVSLSGAEGKAKTEILYWVGGAGMPAWPNLAFQRLRLSAEKTGYNPGETASIFVPNPFSVDVPALVSVERATVLRYRIETVPAGGGTLEVPLGADDAPNVYISVILLGREDGNLPGFRQGYIALDVAPVEQTLSVALISQPQRLEPGEEATFELLVTDLAGNPVQGEFSLSVVDLAVLALVEPNAPEILPAFYSKQPLGVNTSLSLASYGRRDAPLILGRGGGGGEMQSPVALRENFPDTAYWNPEVVTGADGRATLTVTLPDSLTTWQVEARGLTADTRVGQAEAQVVVTKDLLVRPVTPRFVTVNDHLPLAAVVQNNTASTLDVEVSLEAAGFSLDNPASAAQTASIEAGGRARVEWWGVVQDGTQLEPVFSARSGGYQDATRPASGVLPVLRYTAPQSFRTSGVLDQPGSVLEVVSLPRSFDPSSGELKIELAPSLAAALSDALNVLETFPYACTEQTLSRFLPNLETYQAMKALGVTAPALKERLDRTLRDGLQALVARQNADGGWGWWQGGQSDTTITAYALFGLARARDAGTGPEANTIDRAVEYLRSNLPAPQSLSETWELDRLAFQHFALISAGAGDSAPLAALYAERARLNPWAQALLALSLENTSPGSAEAQTLLSDLETSAIRSASGAHWEMDNPAGTNLTNNLTNSAMVVYALAHFDPRSPLIADAARYLMAHRDAQGAWGTTYTTAWTLLALTEMMRSTGELNASFTFSAALNGTPLASGQAGGAGQLTATSTSVPLSRLYPQAPNALNIERSAGGGRLYYTAGLDVSQPVDEVAPLRRGLSLERRFEPFAQPGGEALQSGRIGQKVTVRLTLTLPHDAYYLFVEDYIPAGSEILDTRLKTSQQGEGGEAQAATPYDPRNPFAQGWGWWLFHPAQIYDDHIAWAADYLPAGTYELTYTLTLLQPGEFRVMPARAWQFYFPEVQANSSGEMFEIK